MLDTYRQEKETPISPVSRLHCSIFAKELLLSKTFSTLLRFWNKDATMKNFSAPMCKKLLQFMEKNMKKLELFCRKFANFLLTSFVPEAVLDPGDIF